LGNEKEKKGDSSVYWERRGDRTANWFYKKNKPAEMVKKKALGFLFGPGELDESTRINTRRRSSETAGDAVLWGSGKKK